MYQSPDFIKVELDVKDNFASYSSCYKNNVTVYTNLDMTGASRCMDDILYSYETSKTDIQCFVGDMSY